MAARVPERLNWALVAFPLLVSVRLSRPIELTCLLLLIIVALHGKPLSRGESRQYLPLALVAGAAVMGLRGAPAYETVALVAGAMAAVLASRRATAHVALRSLVTGMGLYLAANIVGHLTGVQSPSAAVRVGLLDGRVLFPFVRSINEPAIVAAAFLGYVLVSRRRGQSVGKLGIWGSVAALFVISASASRFPLIVMLMAVPAVLLLPRLARLAPALGLALVGLPFAYVALMPLINAAAGHLAMVPFLARGQSAKDLAGGSSRSLIWETGMEFWWRVPGGLAQFFGYGFNGHVESGVVYLYYPPNSFLTSPAGLTLHNSFLQQMFDAGYVGLALLIVGLAIVAGRSSRAGHLPGSTLLAILFATSAVEVYLVPSFRSTPFLLVVALAAIVPRCARDDRQSRRRTRAPGAVGSQRVPTARP